jgi:glycosyltransferase involved in cell wall biosynthesis
VTVVIPAWNGARFLAETLRSVAGQAQSGVELILVDDGSTDSTLDIVTAMSPQAIVLEQPNSGVSSARNHGLQAARGRYVIFLDQDDVWHPLQLQRQVAWLEANPQTGAAVCPHHHWHPVGGVYPEPESVWGPDPGLCVVEDFTGYVYHHFLADCWALTSGTLLRRDAVMAAGGFDETLPYSEDWDLWLRLSRATQFALLRWPPTLYRHHPVQGSRSVRMRNHRVELLERYAARYGMASADGRAMDPLRFADILARYQAEFGRRHVACGDRWLGIRTLLCAWARRPRHVRRLAMAVAAGLGWRPRA